MGVFPVVLEALALDREDRNAAVGDRRRRMVLRRIDVARRPADVGAEIGQRLDQHGGLDRHVQRAGDARAFQRLLRAELLAGRHETGHFGLGHVDFLAAPVGEADVLDGVVVGLGFYSLAHEAYALLLNSAVDSVTGSAAQKGAQVGAQRNAAPAGTGVVMRPYNKAGPRSKGDIKKCLYAPPIRPGSPVEPRKRRNWPRFDYPEGHGQGTGGRLKSRRCLSLGHSSGKRPMDSSIPATHPLDLATRLTPAGEGRFTGRTSPAYWNMMGPFGGTTAALMLKAALDAPQRLGDPVALTVNFCAPIAEGAFTIEITEARTNRSTQHWTMTLSQENGIAATASAVFAKRRETWAHQPAACPTIPPFETLAPMETEGRNAWLQRYDLYLDRRGDEGFQVQSSALRARCSVHDTDIMRHIPRSFSMPTSGA